MSVIGNCDSDSGTHDEGSTTNKSKRTKNISRTKRLEGQKKFQLKIFQTNISKLQTRIFSRLFIHMVYRVFLF